MADVKKVTGFHAADGSFHTTRKAAIEHSDKLKVMEGLKAYCESIEGEQCPDDETVPEYLYRHRAGISAAFGMKAQLRAKSTKPRKPRAKKTAEVVVAQSPAERAAIGA